MLRHYQHFDRTRLFGPEWTVTQQWTSLNVPWSVDYLETKFKVSLARASHVVIVLSQLDDRYFRGLEGQYEFHLQFRIHHAGEEDYIVRSNSTYYMRRSVSTELNLDEGDYFILLKVTAKRYPNDPTPEDLVRQTCHNRREKLLSIGLSYDLAHAKGQFRLLERLDKERAKRLRRERRKDSAKKMHEGRRNVHKKSKLKGIKTEMRKQEKARQRELREIEKQKAAAEAEAAAAAAAATQQADTESLERGFEGFTMGEKHGKDVTGLGIVDEPQAHSGSSSLPTPAQSPAPTQLQHSSFPALMNGEITSSPRPATPPLPHRSSMPAGVRPSRKDTLQRVNPPSRRGTLSPLPQVRISRPSIVEAHRNGKALSLSDISDDDMSWDSEIDGPEDSESDLEDGTGHRPRDGYGSGPSFFGMGMDGGDNHSDKSGDEDESDPWNAVCVVGLRVFCEDKDREAGVKIEVLRPGDKGYEPESNRGGGMRALGQRRLDIDDAAESAARGVRRAMFGSYGYGVVEGSIGGLPAHLEPR